MEREKIKIEAIISSCGQVFYVINRPLQMSYTKIDHETIIGEDEGALRFYKRDNMTLPFGKTAFGGRKFTLQLTDGSVEECHGQWWDDMSKSARELFKDTRLCHFAHGTKEELKNVMFSTAVFVKWYGLKNYSLNIKEMFLNTGNMKKF